MLLITSRSVAWEKQLPTISFRKSEDCSRKVMAALIRNTSILSKLYLSYINLQEGLLKVPSGSFRGLRPQTISPLPCWIVIACSVLAFISHGKQSDECTWRIISVWLREISINVNKRWQRCCFSVFYTALICCLFTF